MPTLEAADISSLRADNPDFKYLLDHLIKDGGVLRDLRGITKDEMEAIYSVAYNLYRAGKHEDAEKVFRFLCFFDHLEKKFWMGLGASQQALKKYGPAIDAYSYASILDIHDPRPPLQAADCYIAMGDQVKAESALTAAIEFSGSQPQMKAFKERATTLLNLLKKTETQSA